MRDRKIIGIILIRNEDIYIERVIKNILGFCDKILVADNLSVDATAKIVKRLADGKGNVEYHKILTPGASHEMIKKYIGSNTWIFGVDGDEIYDPNGLRMLRDKILAGEYEKWWMVFGNVLNCASIDLERKVAEGYLSPPSRSMTKLYNFGAITKWEGSMVERLHGGRIIFKDGYDEKSRFNLHLNTPWEESPFRCLHLCFLRRSSKDSANISARENIMEIASMGFIKRVGRSFFGPKTLETIGGYKKRKYMRGDLVTVDIAPFLQ